MTPEQPFAEWIGRSETTTDWIAPAQAEAVLATLDDTNTPLIQGSPLPPLWHWFFFLAKVPQSRIGPDGHPERGGFMPPIALPRRMFAGARLTFHRPLRIGEIATRTATIRSVSEKSGKSGTLAFVTVHHAISQEGDLCIEEEQDIVYREASSIPVPAPIPVPLAPAPKGAWVRTITPNPVLLFRFSAITFNAHRIHYDRPYATTDEGYPGLVVHGPLTAVLLMDLVRQNTAQTVSTYSFRGLAPLFDLVPFRITGVREEKRVTLEASSPNGKPAMTATAELS